jgi:hypothetical protein
MKHEFELGYVNGRQWLSNFIAEADKSLDDYIALNLKNRKPPAFKASDDPSTENRTEKLSYISKRFEVSA